MGSTVANGMNGNTHTEFSGGAYRLLHFLFRQYEYAAIIRIAFKTVEHGCSLRTKCAISEDFDAAQVQHVIAKPRSQSHFSKLRQHLARQNHSDTHTQRSLFAQLLKEIERVTLFDIVDGSETSLL